MVHNCNQSFDPSDISTIITHVVAIPSDCCLTLKPLGYIFFQNVILLFNDIHNTYGFKGILNLSSPLFHFQ